MVKIRTAEGYITTLSKSLRNTYITENSLKRLCTDKILVLIVICLESQGIKLCYYKAVTPF